MSSSRKTLLFTGGGGAGSDGLNRLLAGNYDVHFADADIGAKPYSISSESWHAIPLASSGDFVPVVRDLCARLKVDLLIPTVDEELLPIAEARARFDCEVLLPAVDFIATHLDKFRSSSLLEKVGVPAPGTELASARSRVAFPCVVKPRRGRGSRGVAVVRSEDELRAHLLLSRRQADDFIAQELLEGQEYTVMMAADSAARLCAVVPVRVGIKRGITLRAETDNDAEVIAACKAIHRAYPGAACYNIQLVKTTSGAVKPFEINPRISTTACLGVAAGIDFVGIYLTGAPTTELLPFANRYSLKRSWHNELTAANN